MSKQFSFEIVQHISTLSNSGTSRVEVNKISFNGKPPKLDIRRWLYSGDERVKMLKGIALDSDEEAALTAALNPGA